MALKVCIDTEIMRWESISNSCFSQNITFRYGSLLCGLCPENSRIGNQLSEKSELPAYLLYNVQCQHWRRIFNIFSTWSKSKIVNSNNLKKKRVFNDFLYQRINYLCFVCGWWLAGVVYCLFTAVNSLNWPKRRTGRGRGRGGTKHSIILRRGI